MKEYICYIGFYSNVDVIVNLKNKLKEIGFDAILREEDRVYYLELFSSPNKNFVESMISLLANHGYHANMFYKEIDEDYTGFSV